MIRRGVIAIAALAAALWAGVGPATADEVTLKLWSRADRSGPLRAPHFVPAPPFAHTINLTSSRPGSG